MDPRERFYDLQEALRVVMESFGADTWTALPGNIISFDAGKCTAVVRCGILRRFRVVPPEGGNGRLEDRAIPDLPDVPIIFPRGGGYSLTFPVAAGDPCLVVFASRNIDAWWQSGEPAPAMTARMHDLSDGFAILGPVTQNGRISGISGDSVQLRNGAGDAVVQIRGDEVTLKATKVIIDAPEVEVTGELRVEGDVRSGSVSLQQHRHTQTQPGSGQSGIPQQ